MARLIETDEGLVVRDDWQEFKRTWFALLADGTLAILGDHGDYEAADATASDLGYDAIWLVCGTDAAQWADTINSQRAGD